MDDQQARDLRRRAGAVISHGKHWHLQPDDYQDALSELVAEGLLVLTAYELGGVDQVLTVMMRRAFGRWEYAKRKTHAHEADDRAEDRPYKDTYFAGTGDEHAS